LPPMASERPVDVARSPAVALFVARAQAVTPAFALDAGNARDVAQICRRLDGLPLAIELAAARTTLLSPAELRTRLGASLELLSTGARDLPARQQTLRATIDWSYRLLTQREADAFARLGVFSGGCTVAAAEAVCGARLDELAALVDINLLQRWQTGRGEARLLMLETVGEYARELLGQSAERASIGLLHARHYCELAEASGPALAGPRRAEHDRLEAEYDNFVAALRWCDEHEEYEHGLRLACSLAPFWRIRGRARDGREWLSRLLMGADVIPHPLHARARYENGWLCVNQGDYERGLPELDNALALFRQLHDLDGQARCLAELAFTYAEVGQDARARRLAGEALRLGRRSGDTRTIASALDASARASRSAAEATTLAEEALECYRRLGDAFWTAALLNNLGYLALTQGDPEGGLVRLQESADIAEDLHDEAGLATARGNIGLAYLLIGDRERAGRALADAVTVADELGYSALLSECLIAIAALAVREHRPREAARLVGVAEQFRRSPPSPAETILEARYLRPARAEMGETAWAAARAEGAAIGADDGLVLACELAVTAADRDPTAI
jgi:tetratricopeptide (TPR) repeat protein